jgi:hypothetical protein
MNNQEQLIGHLQVSLDQITSKKTKEWWEKYLRNVILFRGVGIPEVREKLAQWRLEYSIATWDKQEQLSIALKFFESSIAEDKLAGILFLQEYL